MGDIAFPSDYSTTAEPNFFFGINDTDVGIDASGVYRFQGASVPGASVITNVSGPAQVITLDVAGPIASVVILAGLTDGTVIRSLDGGAPWLNVNQQPAGSGNTYVVLVLDFTTSKIAWALVSGTNGGLSLTTDSGATWTLIWP